MYSKPFLTYNGSAQELVLGKLEGQDPDHDTLTGELIAAPRLFTTEVD